MRELEFQLKILTKTLSLFELPNSCNLRYDCNMRKMTSLVFSMRDLGLRTVESDGDVDLGIVFFEINASFHASTNNRRSPRFHGYRHNADRNFLGGGSLLKDLLDLCLVIGP